MNNTNKKFDIIKKQICYEVNKIYRSIKQDIENNGQALPLDKAFISKVGSDITLISWGAMLTETLQAAEQLEQTGISTEVIDVASIKPLDTNTIISSVEKTGRCVIVHEAHKNVGVGAEICAQIMEYAFDSLEAPVQRVTGFDCVMPYFKLEDHFIPSTKKIVNAVNNIMEYA